MSFELWAKHSAFRQYECAGKCGASFEFPRCAESRIQPTVTLIDGSAAPQVSHSLFFPSHLEEMDKYPVFLDGNHSLVTIQNPNAEGGNLLVIRDSYAHCFSTFLASDYQNIYLVDLRYYRDNLSQFVAEHPVDRVLYLYGVDNLVSDTNSAWLK